MIDKAGVGTHTTLELYERAGFLLVGVKFLVYLFITLGVYRLLQIVEDIREGVEGARHEPDTAVLLGKRAIRRLLDVVKDPETPAPVRENALLALGRTRELDPRAVEVLTDHAVGRAETLDLPPPPTENESSEEGKWRKEREWEVQRLRAAATLGLGYLASSLPDLSTARPLDRAPIPAHLRGRCREIVDTLALLLDQSREKVDIVRESAAIALGLIDHQAAGKQLLTRLRVIQEVVKERSKEPQPEVLKHLAQSVGDRLGIDWRARCPKPTRPRTPTPDDPLEDQEANSRQALALILDTANIDPDTLELKHQGVNSLLRHRYLRVRNRAAAALGRLGNPDVLPALVDALNENDNPKLLVAWAKAVGALVRLSPADGGEPPPTVTELIALIERVNNGSVRLATAEALAELAKTHPAAVGPETVDALEWVLQESYIQDDREVQEPIEKMLREVFHASDRAQAAKARFSFDVLADQVDVVVDATRPVSERVAAAERIQPLKDQGSLSKLELLLEEWDEAQVKSSEEQTLCETVRAKAKQMEDVVEGRRTPRGEPTSPSAN